MRNRLEKQVKIPISWCDNTSKLSITGIFNLFMDLATEHGDELGLGMKPLAEKGLFWVASKTKIKITNRPEMLSDTVAATWPEKPARIRCNRYYTLTDNGNMLVEGKTEWVMLDAKSARPAKIEGTYPADMEHCPDIVCTEPFCRLSSDFSEADKLAEYTVCSADIDVSQHMNNVAYIRLVMELFSCKELEELSIKEMEVCYKEQITCNRILCFKA